MRKVSLVLACILLWITGGAVFAWAGTTIFFVWAEPQTVFEVQVSDQVRALTTIILALLALMVSVITTFLALYALDRVKEYEE